MDSEKTYIVHAREQCPFCVSAVNLLSTLRGQVTYCVFFHENKRDPKLLQEQKRNTNPERRPPVQLKPTPGSEN